MTRLLALAIAACSTDIQSFSGDADVPPCAVAAVLEAHCTTCHGEPPHGAPMSLVRYADLVAPSPLGGSVAHRALVRMTDEASPMPPGARVTVSPAEVATFEAWLDAGTPSDPGASLSACAPLLHSP